MADLLLSEGYTTKAKEAGNFAFYITDIVIPDGMARIDVVACLADAGIYTTEDDLVYGMDVSDSHNERMIIKAVGNPAESSHKPSPVALSQLAEALPSSRTISCELDEIGAYACNEGRQTMANVSVLPFGGVSSLEVAYVAGVNLLSNMHTAERMEAFTRFLLYSTITSIIHGLAEPEKQWFDKYNALANGSSSPVAQRNAHKKKAERSRTRLLQAMGVLAAAPIEIYEVRQCTFALFDVTGTLDSTARPTDRAERSMNNSCTSLANAFKSESGLMTVLKRTNGITAEQKRLGREIRDRLTSKPLCGSAEMKEKLKGKFVEEQVRLDVPSKETAKMITEGIIKTKLHVAACSGANSTAGTDAMRPWRFDGLALEKFNNPITSVKRTPHTTTDDTPVVAWMEAFVAAKLPNKHNPSPTSSAGRAEENGFRIGGP